MNTTFLVIGLYLVAMLLISLWCARGGRTSAQYYTNNKNTSLFFMALSTVSTVFGAGAFVGVTSEIYKTGISMGIALPVALVCGMFILAMCSPAICRARDRYQCVSFTDFIQRRFDRRCGSLFSVVQLVLIVMWAGVQAIAMIAVMNSFIIHDNLALVLAVLVSLAYVAFGGIKADIISDVVQFFLILAILVFLAILGSFETGPLDTLSSSVPAAHLDPFNYGGVGFFIGICLLSGFMFLGNASHWQRIFSTRTGTEARNSFLISIPLLFILAILTIYIGLVSVVLLPSATEPNQAVFDIMKRLLPQGFESLGVVVIFAIVLTSINSLLIAGSAILQSMTRDHMGDDVRTARIFSVVLGIFSYGLAVLYPDIIQFSLLVTFVALCFVPSVLAGLFSERISGSAAFYSLLGALLLLVATFPFLGNNAFVLPVFFGAIIILFYDRLKMMRVGKV